MSTSAAEENCYHCYARVTAREVADGWCDSCGKRLPSSAQAKSPVAGASPAKLIEDSPPRIGWVLAGGGALILALAATAVVVYFLG